MPRHPINVKHPPCDGCGVAFNRLFVAFTNGQGWGNLCAGCLNPRESGSSRPYLGPYPIKRARAHLTLVQDA